MGRVNKYGCTVREDVCLQHSEPLTCRHGCAEAVPHPCGDKLAEAWATADRLSLKTGRTRIVRNSGFSDAPIYFVCPQYEPELGEGRRHDAGYTGVGSPCGRLRRKP